MAKERNIDELVKDVEGKLTERIISLAEQVNEINKQIKDMPASITSNRLRNNKPLGVLKQEELASLWLEVYRDVDAIKLLESKTGYSADSGEEKLLSIIELYMKKNKLQAEIGKLTDKRSKASEMYSDETKKRNFLETLLSE